MNDQMQDCIKKCQTCRDVCLQTLEYATEQGADYIDDTHQKLLEDCAKICDTSAEYLERESENHSKVCAVCAELCEKCAEACEAMVDDEQMQECARVCRECAESCRDMSED